MSWHSEATTTSLSAPDRSARVAVWRQCVSWSTANPSTLVDSICNSCRTVSPWCCWLLADSTPIWPHCSAVDSSMRVKVCVMPQSYVWARNVLVGRLEPCVECAETAAVVTSWSRARLKSSCVVAVGQLAVVPVLVVAVADHGLSLVGPVDRRRGRSAED